MRRSLDDRGVFFTDEAGDLWWAPPEPDAERDATRPDEVAEAD